MSDQTKKPNDGTPHQAEPGKRLDRKAEPALTPAQARKKKEKRIMIIMIVAAVIMVAAAAVVLLVNRLFKEPELPPVGPTQSDAPNHSPEPGESDEPEFKLDTVEPKVGGERKSAKIFTILIFGSDETSGLTDTMMVATYDVTNQRATVMSLPRDTLINSSARPNISAKKLNAVYNVYGKGDEGIEALKNEVSEIVGFTPDYYVQIDWELVGEMVDAIGGVWFDNPYHMEYYDPYQDLNIYQERGYRFIDGDDAMQIVRWRENNPGVASGGTGSDLDRLNVQHTFLKAVLKETLQIKTLFKVNQLMELFNSRVKSNLALEEMLWFAREAVVGGLQVDDVEFCTMPNVYGSYYQFGRDWYFVCPNQGKLLPLINESLNPFKEEVTIKQLDLMSVSADGSLRSSTGRLAAPELGEIPVRETPPPEESEAPVESGEPSTSDPVESDPLESGAVSSDPAGGDPGPVATDSPPAEPSAPVDVPAGPVDGGPEQSAAAPDGEDITSWGDTPD